MLITFGTDPGWILLITLHSTKPFLKQEMNSLSVGWVDIPSDPTKLSSHREAWKRLHAEQSYTNYSNKFANRKAV